MPLPQGGNATPDIREDDLALRDLTYGDGKLVVAGGKAYNQGFILVSDRDSAFRGIDIESDPPRSFAHVAYAGGRFFAFSGLAEAYSSSDAVTWSRLNFPVPVIPNAVAFGNSMFLIAANGGLEISSDAESWRHANVNCGLPGACVEDPDGQYHSILQSAFFSSGRFYVNDLVSEDGATWQSNSGPVPSTHFAGYDFGSNPAGQWFAWKPGTEPVPLLVQSFAKDENGFELNPGMLAPSGVSESIPAPPEAVDWSTDDGRDCTNSRCLVLNGRLFLGR